MTIIASVKVRDGVVLATDSMNQISIRDQSGQVGIIKSYCNAKKLFQIRDLPIGLMSYGLGNIGKRSVESLVLEFSRDLDKHASPPYTVECVSRAFHDFIKTLYDTAFQGVPLKQQKEHLRLGFLVCGYSPGKFLAVVWGFELPQIRDLKEIVGEESIGSNWRGVPVPFARLHNGFDPRIVKELRKAGVAEEVIQETLKIDKWRMPIVYDGMPVQDAVNFAVYILETTIGAATFELGVAPSCGGPLQVAVILPDKGWQWVKEPELFVQ